MFVQEEDGSKLSRGAPGLVEAVEKPENGLGVGTDLLPAFFDLRDQLRVDLLVAKEDLAVELARLLDQLLVPLLARLLKAQGLLVLVANEFSKAFAAEHETYCRRPQRTSYARNVKASA